jgi:hypothetical protein
MRQEQIDVRRVPFLLFHQIDESPAIQKRNRDGDPAPGASLEGIVGDVTEKSSPAVVADELRMVPIGACRKCFLPLFLQQLGVGLAQKPGIMVFAPLPGSAPFGKLWAVQRFERPSPEIYLP